MAEQSDAEQVAQRFHETYERLAPDFGYRTREASAKPWTEVPEQNRAPMIAVCAELLDSQFIERQSPQGRSRDLHGTVR
jgi:hypothetical protein